MTVSESPAVGVVGLGLLDCGSRDAGSGLGSGLLGWGSITAGPWLLGWGFREQNSRI